MREAFHSLGDGGMSQQTPPVRLYQLAKRWFWDPVAIDFTQDARDWQTLTPMQQDVILRLTSLFQGGEEAVTLDLLPLMQVIAREGRLEEEMYLTSFLFEEAKHVEFFRRFLDAIGVREDLHRYHSENYRRIFYEELPRAMGRLTTDPSPAAQAEAAVTYNVVVEGMLAETGYHAYFTMLEQAGIMPGLRAGLVHTQRDESRHIAWGIYHLSRLVATDQTLLEIIQNRAADLAAYALGMISDLFASYETMPFPLIRESFLDYALDQYQRRLAVIERARVETPENLMETLELDQ